jgi:hypothetical protein
MKLFNNNKWTITLLIVGALIVMGAAMYLRRPSKKISFWPQRPAHRIQDCLIN